jgi:prepilin-type N-terminal cleavage/methylation domain-containing protein
MTRGSCKPGRQLGFTLVELVVAIAISAVVVVFAALFIAAPVDAYEAQSRRHLLLADASAVWPRMQQDLRRALPNSVRARRNGSFMTLEMLTVVGHARYMATPDDNFRVAGTGRGIFDDYGTGTIFRDVHLSVNNLGTPGADAYALAGSMTPVIDVRVLPNGPPGSGIARLNLSTPANFTAGHSPQHKIYVVTGAVSYLCDESQGTLRRYTQYTIAANQAARDEPADFAGASSELVSQGLATCHFQHSAPGGNRPQTVAVHLTTTRDNETVRLMHTLSTEYVP